MDVIKTIDAMSTDMYLRLKCAAETGKWPEGVAVDQAQRDTALQLIMAYQARHLDSDEMLTIGSDGNMVHKNKRQLKEQFTSAAKDKPIVPCTKPDEETPKSDIAHFTDL